MEEFWNFDPEQFENNQRVVLEFKQLGVAELVDYDFLRSTEGEAYLDSRKCALVLKLRAWLAGEVLDKKTLDEPADWRSHLWYGFSQWCAVRRGRMSQLAARLGWWVRLERWASRKVVWRHHVWEVRREWLDVVYEGHGTKVRAYYNGTPATKGVGKARDDFMAAFLALRSAPYDFTDTLPLIRELLEAAERTDWRRWLG